MKIYLAGKFVSQMSTYCRVIQPTTSNNSCDRLINHATSDTMGIHHVHQEYLPDKKSSLHTHMSIHPPLDPQLDQLLGLSHHIAYT